MNLFRIFHYLLVKAALRKTSAPFKTLTALYALKTIGYRTFYFDRCFNIFMSGRSLVISLHYLVISKVLHLRKKILSTL